MVWIFVYGTLRSGGVAAELLGSAVRRPARLDGYALYGRTMPYPFAVAEPGAQVEGEAVWLEPAGADARLAELDRYEGGQYRRVTAPIHLDGMEVESQVWVAVRPQDFAPGERIPSGDWFRR